MFPYLKFTPFSFENAAEGDLPITSANKQWEEITIKPEKNKLSDYKSLVNKFYTDLQSLITYINTEGNPILKDDLKYNMTFHIELEQKKYYYDTEKKRPRKEPFIWGVKRFEAPQFYLWLKIPEYEGEVNAVEKAHSFLNEARLTAVGLAMRLAILKRRLSEKAILKLLVLDDLLISLDMSNREKVLELILNKYQKEYQLFVLTHDRTFFNITKKKINLEYDASQWIFYDVFEIKEEEIHKPLIRVSKDPLSIAKDHFKNQDYPATVNYQRSFLEGWFINFIPELRLKYEANKGKDLFTARMLEQLLQKADTYFDELHFDKEILTKIRLYKDLLLNPLSHHENGKADIYKKEIDDIFDIITSLLKIKNDAVIKVNKSIRYTIITQEGCQFVFTLQLLNDFRCYKQVDTDFSFDSKISIQVLSTKKIDTEGGETIFSAVPPRQLKNKTFKDLYDDGTAGILKYEKQTPIVETNYQNIFLTDDDKTLNEIMENISK